MEAIVHPFLKELSLRDLNTRLPTGRPLPPLFNLKPHIEVEYAFVCFPVLYVALIVEQLELKGASVELLSKLIPDHALKAKAMFLPRCSLNDLNLYI